VGARGPGRRLVGALTLGLAAALLGGCASSRVVRIENALLRTQNEVLTDRVAELEGRVLDPETFVVSPDLDTVSRFLDRAGYVHERAPDGRSIRMEFAGKNTSFGLRIQHFAPQDALFVATIDYLRLDQASDSRAAVLLLVQMAALNYDILFGKFQLDPESGEILLSGEIALEDGLGYASFVRLVDAIARTADERWVELSRAAGGRGL
jgi:hypothetical protein